MLPLNDGHLPPRDPTVGQELEFLQAPWPHKKTELNNNNNHTVKAILAVMKQLKQLQRKCRQNAEALTEFKPMTSIHQDCSF